MEKLTLENFKQDCSVLKSPIWEYIIENKEWYPIGVKTHLLLMMPQVFAAIGGLSRVYQPGHKDAIATVENKYMKAYYDPRDFRAIYKSMIKNLEEDPEWYIKFKKSFEKSTEIFINTTEYINKNLNKYSKAELITAIEKLINSAIQCQSYGYITQCFNIMKEEYWVTKYIKSLCDNLSKKDIDILLTSTTPSFISNFELELYNASENDIPKILKKFYWIKSSYYSQLNLTIQDLKEEKEKLNKSNNNYEGLKNKKELIFQKCENSNKLRIFVNFVDVFITLQDERKVNVLRLNHLLQKIVEKIHEFLPNWSIDEIYSLTPHELLDLLNGKISEEFKHTIKKRNEKSVWVISDKAYCITTDEKIVKKIFKLMEEEESDILDGFVASEGKVKGKAKIIISEDDFHKMEEGDILITSMTRPEFIPVMKKAAAFVTNEGGITCHAAIVSREMKKPCIIGTKIATKVFKDGDLIEVDANKGVVKKLDKK